VNLFSGRPATAKSLTHLLTSAFVLFSLVILVVAGGLKFFFYYQSETAGLYSKQQLITESAKAAVGGFLQEKIHELEAWANLTNPDAMETADWRLALQRLLGLGPAFRTLAAINLEGDPIAFVSRFTPSQIERASRIFDNVHYPRTSPDAASISEVYIDAETSEPIVSIRVPVTDALRESKVYLLAELNLRFIWDFVAKLAAGSTGYVYVVDHTGRLIAYGDISRVIKGENVSHLPPVALQLDAAAGGAHDRARIYRGLTGSRVIGTAAPLTEAGWTIVAEMPWQEAYRNVIRIGAATVAITILIAFLAAMLGAMISRKLAVPLAELKNTAVRIANGDRSLQAQLTGPAEVAQLATAFNSMASQLVGSLKETEHQYAQAIAARAALQTSETRLRLVLEGTTDGVWDVQTSVDEAYCSPRWFEILGYEPDAFPVTMDSWRAMILPEDREHVERVYAHALASSEPFAVEFRMKCKNGRWLWVLSRGKVVETTADGRPARLSGSLADITKRKLAEQEKAELEAKFLQAQKMESIGRLAGGVAHDFNNLLTVILGRAELAMMSLSTADPFYEDFAEILAVGKRSAALTRQLLGFARKQTIEPRPLDFNRTVEDMLGLLRRLTGEGIQVVWRPSAGLWPVKMDPAQIDQLLANLLINAKDAIADVGTVTIETYNSTLDHAYCCAHHGYQPGDYVVLVVSDDGCGMDKETLANIYEPFFTTKRLGQGTGLGLATVYGIVKQNNGFINAYSEPGNGSTFKIYLPRHFAGDAMPAAAATAPHVQTGSETILLVEDEEALLDIMTAMLKELGYRILTADSPHAALELVQKYDAPIHLLLTDVIMPGMNGRELQKRINALLPELKCLFISGYTANVIAHQGILEEGLNFLNKPFSFQDLATKLRSVLEAD
jgi:PAS domain S-box-containing protein